MPNRLAAPCAAPGCPALTLTGRCAEHAPAARRASDVRYNQQRGSSTQQGYGARWRRLRLSVLRADPFCRECRAAGRLVAATDVDHIVPRRRGGSDARSNLQPLCHSCHSRKTGAEMGGGRAGNVARKLT